MIRPLPVREDFAFSVESINLEGLVRAPSNSLDGERVTTPAGSRCIRVVDDKLGPLQPLTVIDLCAEKILIAQRVNQHRHTLALDNRIVLRYLFIESKSVGKTTAATTGDEDPELQGIVVFDLDELLHFLCGSL